MHPIAFRDYLWEVRKYLTLTPGTKAHKEAFHDLCEKLPDADTFDPQVKKWERITLICALLTLVGFISLIVLCALTAHRGQELFTPIQRRIAFGLLALFLLPEIPMLYAHFHGKHLAKAFMEREIHLFGEQLNRLSDEQFSRVWELLNSDPEYFYGDEPPESDDRCGCYECGHIFPADAPGLNWAEDIPSCPHCDSPFLACGTANVPVEEETFLLIHNLFFEEK